MVFSSDRQRKGFFARLEGIKKRHEVTVQKKLEQKRKAEEKELTKLQVELKQRQTSAALQNAKTQQILKQRQQIDVIKRQEKKAKEQISRLTTKGKVINFLKKEAKIVGRATGRGLVVTGKAAGRGVIVTGKAAGRGAVLIGKDVKRVATVKNTRSVLKSISKAAKNI